MILDVCKEDTVKAAAAEVRSQLKERGLRLVAIFNNAGKHQHYSIHGTSQHRVISLRLAGVAEAALRHVSSTVCHRAIHICTYVIPGVAGADLPVELQSAENSKFVFSVNVFGVVTMLNHFVPLLREGRHLPS